MSSAEARNASQNALPPGSRVEDWPESKLNALVTVNVFFSVISFIGSFIIVCSYLYFKPLQKFAFRLVFWLSISDLFYGIANMIGNPADGSFGCTLQAWMINYFELSSVLWTTVIAYTLYQSGVKYNLSVERRSKYFHAFCWGVPLILSIIPQTLNLYGSSGGFCWISTNDIAYYAEANAMRYICFYLVLWVAIAYNSYSYYVVIRTIKRVFRMQEDGGEGASAGSAQLKMISRLKLYPMIMALVWFWATVNRIQQTINPTYVVDWLMFLHVIFGSLQGFGNFVVYGFTPAVQREVRAFLRERFPSRFHLEEAFTDTELGMKPVSSV